MVTRRPTWLSLSGSPCSFTWCLSLLPFCVSSIIHSAYYHTTFTTDITFQLRISHQVHFPYYLYPVISVTPKLQTTPTTVVSDIFYHSDNRFAGSSCYLEAYYWRYQQHIISQRPIAADSKICTPLLPPTTPLRKQPQPQQNRFTKLLPCVQFDFGRGKLRAL
jgi:hypothetical protein